MVVGHTPEPPTQGNKGHAEADVAMQGNSYENMCDAAGQRILGMVQCLRDVCKD